MSEFSDITELRSMFEDLSGQPPLVLGRKEAVMLKISRRNQRLVAVRSVAAFGLAAALGLGVVTTTQHFQNTGDEGAQQSVVTEPSHSATPSHEPTPAPSTETTHAPSTEPTHAPAVQTQAPAVEPTPAPAALPAHEPTHSATEPPSTGPSPESTAASGPLTVDLSMSPATVDTSTDTHALVTARDGEGRLLAVDITWGDGKTLHFSPTGQVACPRTTHLDGSFNHRYTSAGSYVVHVTVTTGDCAAQEQVNREGHVTVTGAEPSSPPSPEATATNGPSAPVASGGTRSGDNAAYVYLTAAGRDADGWIRSIVVHWGDGAESSYQYDTSGCTQAAGTSHPVSNQQTSSVPGGHKYASSGDKTVTVTTTSSACDGSGVQSGSTTFTVSAP